MILYIYIYISQDTSSQDTLINYVYMSGYIRNILHTDNNNS